MPTPQCQASIGEVFHCYDPPLWLVTAGTGTADGGCIVTSAMRLSIVAELPRMLVAIARHHATWALIEAGGGFALHLLHAEDFDAVWRFGLRSGHDGPKFAPGEVMARTPGGHPFHASALAWLDCRVEQAGDSGDRSLYLARVADGGRLREGEALGVARLLARAPAERLAELKRLYARDQAIDAAAIVAWRQARGIPADG